MRKTMWVAGLMALLLALAGPVHGAVILPDQGSPGGPYIVQPGDSLYRIAARQGVSISALMAANGFTTLNVILQIGQVLTLPGVPGVPAGGGAAPNPGPTTAAGTYTVQPGDSLYRIAAQQGVDFSALMAANGFTTDKVILQIGQVLNIPGGGSSPVSQPAGVPVQAPSGTPGINHMGTQKVVIADYMMWYDASTFDGTKTWDVPIAGAYNSGDYSTIQRQVAQAQQACLDGFAAHWYGPNESSTTSNFNQLLRASAGTNLRHAVVIQANIWDGASEQSIADAIRYALDNWAYGPNYLRLGGRPVFIFTDMPRPWGSDAAALQGWSRIRASVDPQHKSIWMAEGLYPTYNPLFDGLYVYRIDHRDYPMAWLRQPAWAAGLHAVEQQGNLPLGGLYFADTIAAGFDDTRSVNLGGDRRSDAPHFARDRRNGGYYADTFAATSGTGGDMLFVKSFNEWVEGTQIEPGTTYGNQYLDLTCQYANAYRAR